MGFASAYIEERSLFPEFIKEVPDENTGIIVVVPAYNEPGIDRLLDSLVKCIEPRCKVEVIIVVNAPSDASQESLENNRATIKNIESWKVANKMCFFRLYSFMTGEPPVKKWGVGLARKTGMDEAVRRFNSINNQEGVILNLDADCKVEQNYFVAVCDEMLGKKERGACSIYFEHPLHGEEFPENIYRYITLYELHLRYYFQGLAYSGFPYVFHTVGSAIAVKADAYVKAGGMNRRQAGEDFYFIQKLVPSGGYFNLNSTTVYPSPRPSFRVPFGTGASIDKLNSENSQTFLSYNFMAFKELRSLFSLIDNFYTSDSADLTRYYISFQAGLKMFISEAEWLLKIIEIKNNTSSATAFRKRFFDWFNMFSIVKFLNLVHAHLYEKRPVNICASELLESNGVVFSSGEASDLLLYFRAMEKKC